MWQPRIIPKLCLRDIYVGPKNSSIIESRTNVNLRSTYRFKHSRQKWTGVPLILESKAMPQTLKRDCIHMLPRSVNRDLASSGFPSWMSQTDRYMLTCDISSISQVETIIARLKDQGSPLKFLCIDAENPYYNKIISFLSRLHDKHPETTLVCGPVASPEMVETLVTECRVDIVRIGSERTKHAGVGFPQFSALVECAVVAKEHKAYIANDSDIDNVSELPKAFCAGANFAVLHNPNDLLLDDAETSMRSACMFLGSQNIQDIANNCTFYHVYM